MDSRGKYVYAQAVKVGNMVFISGQGAQDEKGNTVGRGDIQVQTRQVFENIKRLVEAAGGKMSDIVKMNFYTKDIRYLRRGELFASAIREYFGDYPPPSTGVQIANLFFPDMMIEIEAIAIVE